jgi:two-component system NtrC family sensor kinase
MATITAVPLPEAAGALLVTLTDDRETADLEKRLESAESMAAVGKLAARVAHELNNPLDGTLRFIGLCERVLEESAERPRAYLESARQGLRRMAQIVADLLAFSRSTPMLRERSSINRIVEEAMHYLSDHADRHRVILAADFRDEASMPGMEGTRLFQVCSNLIRNGIDAMPEGGCLTMTTALIGEEVYLRFEDTGAGLPEEVEKVFEAFYTTKAAGEGTGLGLAICREYIQQLNGRLEAENRAEGGARFTIRIPLASCTPLA